MIRGFGVLAIISFAHAGVIDQIAAVVGKHAVKTSDIDRDLRVTQFLNAQPPDFSVTQQRAALQRLIDQELIRADLAQAAMAAAPISDAKTLLDQIRTERFKGSDALMNAELKHRGLSQDQLLERLQWQLVVLRFIDERFRPGVMVSEEDVRAKYEQTAEVLKKQDPVHSTFEDWMPKIRESLEGERINANFEDWLQQARKNTRIDYKLEQLK